MLVQSPVEGTFLASVSTEHQEKNGIATESLAMIGKTHINPSLIRLIILEVFETISWLAGLSPQRAVSP